MASRTLNTEVFLDTGTHSDGYILKQFVFQAVFMGFSNYPQVFVFPFSENDFETVQNDIFTETKASEILPYFAIYSFIIN